METHLVGSQEAAVKDVVEAIQEATSSAFLKWVESSKLQDWAEIHAKMSQVNEGAKTGDFTSCAWIELENDATSQAMITRYQHIWTNVKTIHSVAVALKGMFKDIPSLTEKLQAVEEILPNAAAASQAYDAMRDNMCVAGITNLLLLKPRPTNLDVQLKGAEAAASKMGWKVSSLPKYSKQLYDEFVSASPKPASENASTTPTASTASTSPVDNIGGKKRSFNMGNLRAKMARPGS